MSPSEKSLEDIHDKWSQWMWLMELQHGANFSSVGSPLSSVRLFGRPQWLTEVRLFARTPCLSYFGLHKWVISRKHLNNICC